MKVCIYGLSLNQEHLCHDWIEHVKDADQIIVGDLGSTDRTKQILVDHGVTVYDLTIHPWRWDWPRNTLLSLIPKDIDIAIALDVNQKLNNNWKANLFSEWLNGTDKLDCNLKPTNRSVVSCSRIHNPRGYTWKYQINEELSLKQPEQLQKSNTLLITETAEFKLGDSAKLFESTLNDYPKSGKMLWNYGYYNSCNARWDRATEWHLKNIEVGDNPAYKSESMIHLSGLIYGEREIWLTKATLETPWRYQGWFELGNFFYQKGNYSQAMMHLLKALDLSNNEPVLTDTYLNWQVRAHDMVALSSYNLGVKPLALKHAKAAYELNPTDKRLEDNLIAMQNLSK